MQRIAISTSLFLLLSTAFAQQRAHIHQVFDQPGQTFDRYTQESVMVDGFDDDGRALHYSISSEAKEGEMQYYFRFVIQAFSPKKYSMNQCFTADVIWRAGTVKLTLADGSVITSTTPDLARVFYSKGNGQLYFSKNWNPSTPYQLSYLTAWYYFTKNEFKRIAANGVARIDYENIGYSKADQNRVDYRVNKSLTLSKRGQRTLTSRLPTVLRWAEKREQKF